MTKIGLETPRSHHVKTLSAALAALDDIGLPAIIRPSFTLGGTGGGIAYNKVEFIEIVERGIDASPTNEVLVEESVLGWKEFEMEVVRDKADNCIIICSIENVDPMGVHTGDSITVAPALTLTDKEYQVMRDASIAVLREIGVETGGSNVQFAIDPATGRMIVIEMNPRVSRSSALASKATGFPIAKVAAKLAVGYTLDEIANDITGGATPASFEPTIDYVVTKIPRFAFEKFPGAEPILTTAMKSVGEAMAIGRTFGESLQKALRSLETGLSGLDEIEIEGLGHGDDRAVLRAALGTPTPDRLRVVAQALRMGVTRREIYDACKIDLWFIDRMAEIVEMEAKIRRFGLPQDAANLRMLKAMGFSDVRLSVLTGKNEAEVAALRERLDVHPVYKRIDTCAAEFASPTAYMYSTYEAPFAGRPRCEARPSDAKKIVILGGGPNRIGQGIEFDYCCCHACFALAEAGFETIMINCNPETVSTDYDTSDRLYFEPLTTEDVLEILRKEKENGTLVGVIVQFGGQTPLKLARTLEEEGYAVLGTRPEAIDLAEDRGKFAQLLAELDIAAPPHGEARTLEEARAVAAKIGYPVVVRPSYVLGGRAMEIVYGEDELESFVRTAAEASPDHPVLIDRFLEGAIEVDVDAVCDGAEVFIGGVMEHIEEAGVHSGDSSCAIPPATLSDDELDLVEDITRRLAHRLGVVGLLNLQLAVKDERMWVLEANPRASRTVPFVSKVIGVSLAKVATLVLVGRTLEELRAAGEIPADPRRYRHLPYTSVKAAVLPFGRFPGVDTILGPEMKSTGEVMGIDADPGVALAKALVASGAGLPTSGTAFVSVANRDKRAIVFAARRLWEMGFRMLATGGTAGVLARAGIPVERVAKVSEASSSVADLIKNGSVDLVINTPFGRGSRTDGYFIRTASAAAGVPCITTLPGVFAAVRGIEALRGPRTEPRSLQEYHEAAAAAPVQARLGFDETVGVAGGLGEGAS
jgi:carbamoyl-phosphate synthase large subunit